MYSKTPEEHTKHLRTTFKVLRQNELHGKLKKCEFWVDKVAFLGHVIFKDGVSVDP